MGPSGALALRLRALIVALGIPPFVPSPTQPSATMRPRSVTGLVAGRFKIHSPEGKFHGSIRPLAINSPRGQAARQHRVRHDGRRHAPHHPTCRRHPAHLAGMQAGTGELGLFCALRLPPESRRRPRSAGAGAARNGRGAPRLTFGGPRSGWQALPGDPGNTGANPATVGQLGMGDHQAVRRRERAAVPVRTVRRHLRAQRQPHGAGRRLDPAAAGGGWRPLSRPAGGGARTRRRRLGRT